jgi:hypothetical protein
MWNLAGTNGATLKNVFMGAATGVSVADGSTLAIPDNGHESGRPLRLSQQRDVPSLDRVRGDLVLLGYL